jgi:hypothetical protein
MAVTITTGLPADFAAFAPVVIEGTTDRWPFTGVTRQSNSVTSIGSTGSKVNLVSMDDFVVSGFKANDTILIEGLTGTAAQWNGRQNVIEVGAAPENYCRIDQDYTGATISGQTGTAYRMNDNLFIRLNIANDTDSEELGEIYARVADGEFSADVSKTIQQAFSSQFTLATGNQATAAAHGSKEIEITFDEVFTAVDYSLTEATGAATPEEGIGHMSADIADQMNPATFEVSKNTALDYRAADKIIFRAFVDEYNEIDTSCKVEFNPDNGAATDVFATIVNKNLIAVYQIPIGAKQVVITVYSVNSGGVGTVIRNPLTVNVPATHTDKRLYFLNHFGGWHVMEVHKFEDRTVSTKIDKWTVETYTERTLYGIEEHHDTGLYLADLVDSPEIRDEDGELVEVLESDLIYRAELIQPIVKLKIEKNHIT